MKAILHQDYRCAPNGHTVLSFVAGDEVTGRVAEMALADGAGFEPTEPEALETKPAAPLETPKRKRGRPRKDEQK